jgi:hypothetical protein
MCNSPWGARNPHSNTPPGNVLCGTEASVLVKSSCLERILSHPNFCLQDGVPHQCHKTVCEYILYVSQAVLFFCGAISRTPVLVVAIYPSTTKTVPLCLPPASTGTLDSEKMPFNAVQRRNSMISSPYV